MKVVEIRDDEVVLEVDAPPWVKIERKEPREKEEDGFPLVPR